MCFLTLHYHKNFTDIDINNILTHFTLKGCHKGNINLLLRTQLFYPILVKLYN